MKAIKRTIWIRKVKQNIIYQKNSTENIDQNQNSEETDSIEIEGDPSFEARTKKNLLKGKYRIFTNEYDEIKEAAELEKEDEIIRLRKNLDQQLTLSLIHI